MNTPNLASRMWSRARSLGRESWSISSAVAREFKNTRQLGGAWRNVLVAQARQSNQLANSVLTFQQQTNLMRYHGLMNYWKSHRPAILGNAAASPTSMSYSTTDNSTENTTTGSVAQVAFMITTAMRKELTETLGYTAEQIKSLTPVEASLILHHKLPPSEKEEKLPGLVQAHEIEQERIQKEQAELERKKQLKLEQERLEKEKEMTAKQQQTTPNQSQDSTSTPMEILSPEIIQDTTTKVSVQNDPVEGLKVDSSEPPKQPAQQEGSSTKEYETMTGGPMGSFVATMEERLDAKQEWYQVMEHGKDGSSVPVALFNTEDEASDVQKLKEEFAARRAKSDPYNLQNEPTTTYTIRKIVL